MSMAEDYRLTCRAGGANCDEFIIQYLPLYVADIVRSWLEYQPSSSIRTLADLKKAFVGNFQGTYHHPGNPWDLRGCWQEKNESLCDCIRHFSKKGNELPDIVDTDGAFILMGS